MNTRINMKKIKTIFAVIALSTSITGQAQTFQLNGEGYFNAGNVDSEA